MKIKTELYNDNFQNYKRYGIPKAQLVIADIPYNLGKNAYASSTEWYICQSRISCKEFYAKSCRFEYE